MLLSEILIHSTIRIICNNGQTTSCGTGFFFQYSTDNPNLSIPVIVTNKHVVKGSISGTLIFSLRDDKNNYIPGKTHRYNISNFEKCWIFHPDENVDLCVMPIHQFYKEFKPNPYNLYMTYICEKIYQVRKRLRTFRTLKM